MHHYRFPEPVYLVPSPIKEPRVELPVKTVKVDKNITFNQLRAEIIAAVANESRFVVVIPPHLC